MLCDSSFESKGHPESSPSVDVKGHHALKVHLGILKTALVEGPRPRVCKASRKVVVFAGNIWRPIVFKAGVVSSCGPKHLETLGFQRLSLGGTIRITCHISSRIHVTPRVLFSVQITTRAPENM